LELNFDLTPLLGEDLLVFSEGLTSEFLAGDCFGISVGAGTSRF
jgi:hypothetical protein